MVINKTENPQYTRPFALCSVVLLLTVFSASLSDDPLQTLACGAALAFTIALLWRLDEPPILLLPAGIQLIQVITPRLYANAIGVPIENVSLHVGDLTAATWLALSAMIALVIGLWLGQLTNGGTQTSTLQREAQTWSPRSAFVFCVITIVLGAAFEAVSEVSQGLRQPALAAAGVQWMGIFVLASVCMVQRRGAGYLLLVTGLEVAKGFTGYFSDFRAVFYVLLVGLFAVRSRIRGGAVMGGVAVFLVLVAMGAWWSAIKKEYRAYLNQGTRQQVVIVPVEDRIVFLTKKLGEADERTIGYGLELLLQRIGYLDYLSAVMRYVPANMPFQDGAQVIETLMHIVQPRLLFPDKPPLPSDSQVLEKYTGFRWGESSGPDTSVSLGYVAELYVDFGRTGTMIATFIIGLLVGRAYRYVCSSKSMPGLISYGLGVMLVMTITQFDQALIKMTGAFLTAFLAILVLRRFLLPHVLRTLGPAKARRIGVQAAE